MFGVLPVWRLVNLYHLCCPCVLTCHCIYVSVSLMVVRFFVGLFVSVVHINSQFSLYFLWCSNKAVFELLSP